ncbi:MAG: hypothetical protein K0R54_4334, partial [Clostridiaceae bacterium]|nr:hypothetical protein [Clostridiaceae bacterium]
MPNGFWTNDNIKEAINWFLNKLNNNKINSIYEAKKYGFKTLLEEYNLDGLRQSLKKSYKEFFEYIFNKDIFKINNNRYLENIIYIIKPKYNELNDEGKLLINEIIKFCEIEKSFPSMKDLTNKNGYISYLKFKKYFIKYSNIYKYIKSVNKSMLNYWLEKENIIYEFKNYCENICEESILDNMNNNKQLLIWTKKYYQNSKYIRKMVENIGKSHKNTIYLSSYDYLIEAYPKIKENHMLFKWEFNIYKPKNINDINMMLKELVLYRLNNCILNLKEDIPKYLNCSYLQDDYSKFNKYITKKKFRNYYEWAINAFPEYKHIWVEKDFGIIQSKDGVEFDSCEEKNIYEYIKFQNDIFKYIKFIGRCKNSGEYVFQLNDQYEYKQFCPDFVVENIIYKNKKQQLKKPIIIEYYGYYYENKNHHIFQEYVKKTKIKEKFYKSNNDIYYIGIFPEDLKNNFQGLTKKLDLFYLQKIKNN